MVLLQHGLGLGVLALLGARAWASNSSEDLVVPCSNFREVMAPRGAGCRKRMQEVPVTTKERHALSLKLEALIKAGPTESWMDTDDWTQLSIYMLPVRVGLTASITGSRGSIGAGASIEHALQDWAVTAVRSNLKVWGLYSVCIEICLEDDKSDKQTALDIYRRFADPTSGYDVDILLGPGTFDFRDEVAFIAHKFDKTLILWSYGGGHYDHGLGSTQGRLTSDEVTGERVFIKSAHDLPQRLTGEVLVPYVNYSATGLQGLTSNATGSFPVWEQETFLLPGNARPVVYFAVKDQLGDAPQPGDPIVAEGEWPSVHGSEGTAPVPLGKGKDAGNYSYSAFSMELQIDYREETNTLVAHWAKRFQDYRTSVKLVVDELTTISNSSGIKPPIHDLSSYLDHAGISRTMGVTSYTYAWMHGVARSTLDVLATLPQGQSVWRVDGPCAVDADDCLTSPNYPNKYSNKDRCLAIATNTGSAARRLVMTEFDTEAFHDTLLLNDVFYHGHDIELGGITLEGVVELQWYPDDSVGATGWRICPDAAVLLNCIEFACPPGMRHHLQHAEVNCTGHCSPEQCCEEALMDVDGDIWSLGYTNLLDLTVPRSGWALEPLSQLKDKGAKTLRTVLAGMPEPTSKRRCQHTHDLAVSLLGYEPFSETVEPFDWTFPVEHELVNDAWLVRGADVLLLCGDMMTIGLFLTMEEARHVNHHAVVVEQPFGQKLNEVWQNLIHYVVEPLPWPSPLWIWDHFDIPKLPETVADVQISAVGQIIDSVLPRLPDEDNRVWPSLNPKALHQAILSSNTRTFMGDITFAPSGKRNSGRTSCRQFYPLRQMTGETPEVSWDYLQARNIFAVVYIVAPNMSRLEELADIYPDQFEDRYNTLTYPKPFWQRMRQNVYPCPRGCTATGFACAPCPPGQIRSVTEERCTPCPVGTLATKYGLATCQPCPKGAVCDRGPHVPPAAQAGWWDGSVLLELPEQKLDMCSSESGVFPHQQLQREERLFLHCNPENLCTGGDPATACLGNNAGVLCRTCKSGYSWQYYGSGRRLCHSCPSGFSIMARNVVPVLVAFMALTIGWEKAAERAALDTSSLVCPIVKLTFHHFTIFNVILEAMDLDRLADFPNLWEAITRPQEVSFLDCLVSVGTEETRAFNEIFAAIGFTFVGFIVLCGVMCVRLAVLQGRMLLLWARRLVEATPETSYSCWRYQVIQEQQRMLNIVNCAVRRVTIWAIVCFPIVTRAGAVILNQREIGGQCRISKFLDVTCDSPVYRELVLPAAYVAVCVALFLPIPLGFTIYRNRHDLHEIEVRLFLAPFTHGFKQGLELCELGFFLRMVIVLLSLSQQSFTRMIMIFAALAVNEAIQVRLQPFVPQERQMLATYEKISFRVLVVVFSVGACFSFASEVSVPQILEEQEGTSSEGGLFKFVADREYEITLSTLILNGFLVAICFVCITYNQVIIPSAVKIISGDREHLHPLLRRLVASLHFHALRLEEQEDGNFSMNVSSLTDGERSLLCRGIYQTMLTCMHVNTVRFSLLNVMKVLQEALRRAGAAHRAQFRAYREWVEDVTPSSTSSGILDVARLRRLSYFDHKEDKKAKQKGKPALRKQTTVVSMDHKTTVRNLENKQHVDVLVDELYAYLRDVHIDIANGHPLMSFLHPRKVDPKLHPHHKAAGRKRATSASTGDDGDEFSTWCVGDEATAPKEHRMRAGEEGRSGSIARRPSASASNMSLVRRPSATASTSLAPDSSATASATASATLASAPKPADGEAKELNDDETVGREMEKLSVFQQTNEPATFRRRLLDLRVEAQHLRRRWRDRCQANGVNPRDGPEDGEPNDTSRTPPPPPPPPPGTQKGSLRQKPGELKDGSRPDGSRPGSGEAKGTERKGGGPKDGGPKDDAPMRALEDGRPPGSSTESGGASTAENDPERGDTDGSVRLAEALHRGVHEDLFNNPLPPPAGPPPPNIPKIAFRGMRWPGKPPANSASDNSVVGIANV